jgi:hypothetical protein
MNGARFQLGIEAEKMMDGERRLMRPPLFFAKIFRGSQMAWADSFTA